MMNTMMEETLASGTARKAEIPGWTAAGKTGTSQDFRDAWFVGFTSQRPPRCRAQAALQQRRP